MLTSVSVAGGLQAPQAWDVYFLELQKDFLQNLEGVLTQKKISPKSCHDMRVLGRRLRAYLSLLENKKAQKLLKKLKDFHHALSQLRIQDVILETVEEYTKAPHHALLPFKQTLQEERKDIKKKSFKQLRKISIQKVLDDKHNNSLSKFSPKEFESLLKNKKTQTSKAVKKSLSSFLENQKLKALHPLRIRLKKWRYLLEMENSVFPSKNDKIIAQLKILQDELGLIQDRIHLKNKLKNAKKMPPKTIKAILDWEREIKLKNQNALLQWKQEGKNVIESALAS